jgi:hypothetical protein
VKGVDCLLLTPGKILFPSALVHTYSGADCGKECELSCEWWCLETNPKPI